MTDPVSTPSRPARPGWHHHPYQAVRTGKQLTAGERAADVMRNGMGSWPFVFGALVFLALWMGYNRNHGFDRYPFILLNLVLSCVAAMQGAILLISAKRADQISAEIALHTSITADKIKSLVEDNTKLTTAVKALVEENTTLTGTVRDLTTAVRDKLLGSS